MLIVDDSANDLQYIVRVLRDQGYTPHPATEARQALAFVQARVPELILLDVNLPDMDGYQLCRKLKADARIRDVPVIFISGGNSVLDKVRAFSEGAVDYIPKPFQAEEVLARIGTHLSLRRLAAGLVEAKERAEEASLAKSQFLANMSHELRTPLNAVLGYAQILKMSENLDAHQRHAISAIHESGEHLLTLINDILDLARIEAGRLELLPAAMSLTTVLRFVGHMIGVRAQDKGLTFVCECDPGLPSTVMADEKRLSQVLLNLLSNAVKFTSHGSVKLRAQLLSCKDDGFTRLRFAVVDTGCGIASCDIATIFEPFEQVGAAEERAAGAGLGLAICKRIVQLMDSDIAVESQPGVGSTFSFELVLPLAGTASAPVGGAYRDIVGYQGARRRIVVADDVPANRGIVADMLGLAGFRVTQVCDGEQLMEQARAEEADLIVTDVRMPVMNGLDAIRTLRQLPMFATVPIIAMSASSFELDRANALRSGADAFLAKPLDFDRLFDLISELLHLQWIYRAEEGRAA